MLNAIMELMKGEWGLVSTLSAIVVVACAAAIAVMLIMIIVLYIKIGIEDIINRR